MLLFFKSNIRTTKIILIKTKLHVSNAYIEFKYLFEHSFQQTRIATTTETMNM